MTTYDEGLVCDQCDATVFYNVRRYSKSIWYVIYKECEIDRSKEIGFNNSLKLDRVRIINLSNSTHMNCTYGYIQRLMMPSQHICALFDDIKYLVPSCRSDIVNHEFQLLLPFEFLRVLYQYN